MISEAVAGWQRTRTVDAELIQLRKGNPEVLAALVDRFQHRLYRYLLRFTQERSAAEDLFQQTWLRAVENIRRYDERRSFDSWLFAVAHNLAVDHLRKRKPDSLEEVSSPGERFVGEPASADPDALERYLSDERAGILAAVLAEIPAVYREALTLRFEEDMKIEQIAEVTHAPVSTVKSRLRRGLSCLRGKLEQRMR